MKTQKYIYFYSFCSWVRTIWSQKGNIYTGPCGQPARYQEVTNANLEPEETTSLVETTEIIITNKNEEDGICEINIEIPKDGYSFARSETGLTYFLW